ncbi:AfsR/SARP family transcriptional regulator [Lentzea terrae]|uniref:AfsR/SARP family transcriptional regulator n=1 Tax=Lentzea terrae TaxID=2200761 RepID=UPI001E60EF2B|nr:BTAD domain-containing putative transcriptional regulator [Lentzea terrae]
MLGEVAVDGLPVNLGHPKQRCLIAALAVDTGRVVPADRLLERVWGADAPRRSTLHSYVSRLRQALAGVDDLTIEHRSGGYALMGDAVDLVRFRSLCAWARTGPDADRLLTEALSLWQAEALAGVPGEWAEAERARLELERLAAQHDLVDARLRLGHGGRLVVELSARAAEHPLDERVAGQCLLALHQAGRTADALERYRQVRDRLVAEFGTEPGPALRELHQRLLAEPLPAAELLVSAEPRAASDPLATAGSHPPVPRQLPAAPVPFVGRHAELDVLGAGGTVLISAVAGSGGIGKTWLALHWAHRHAARYPDGQLFVDLRGFSPDTAPLDPGTVLRGFLDALGVADDKTPPDTEARAALFRSLVADRRMLVVLDNAATADQVVPLLPGTGTCTVLVTSRRVLTGLVTRHSARHVDLDLLSDAEAHALLEHRLGMPRLAAEPDAVTTLLGYCRRFPLALGILAGRAATQPHLPLAELAAEVREFGVDALDDDDPAASLPAVLATSYQALSVAQQRVFGQLGIAPGPDISVSAAASLTGLPTARAARLLRALQEASLLQRTPDGRYAMHDLIRSYAATTAPDDTALARIVDFYLHTAYAAERLLNPGRPPIELDPPAPHVQPHPLPDLPAAVAWLTTEHTCLLATQHVAAHHLVWQLAWVLTTFHDRRGHRHEEVAVWQAAVDSGGLPDSAARCRAHRSLGSAHARLGQSEEAVTQFQHALALAEADGDLLQQAHTHVATAWAFEMWGDDRQGLEHAQHCLPLYRALGEPAWEALTLNGIGWLAARLGEYDTARRHCEEALVLNRRHSDAQGQATTLDSLGYIAHHTGDHRQAVDTYRQALALYREAGNVVEAANTLDRIGHPHAALGERDQARSAWQEALELYLQQGRDSDAARVRAQLAEDT